MLYSPASTSVSDEEEITFPPTYRYQKGALQKFAWKKVKKTGVCICLYKV